MAGLKIKVLGSRSRVGAAEYERRPGYVFTEDPSCADYDWLVVYDELPGEDLGTTVRSRCVARGNGQSWRRGSPFP